MNVEQIQTFLAVYQHGTYQKAAEALFIPQPTVSHRISQLERELGKALLVRGKGKVALTEEGKVFLPHARRLVAALHEGKEAVSRIGKGETGKLAIGCNNALAVSFLPDAMRSFMSQYPNIRVRVHGHSSHELARFMKMKRFSLGLTRFASSNDRVLTYRCVFTEPLSAIVPANHPLAAQKRAALEDVLKHDILAYPKDTSTRSVLEMILNHRNLPHHIRFESNNLPLLREMLSGGEGALLFAPGYFRRELRSGALSAVEIMDNPFPPSQIFIVYRKGELNGLERLFADHLEQWLLREYP